MATESVDILIAGAGPGGLALASELTRRGIACLLIDEQTEGANTSRACVIHARTLEVLEPFGLVADLLSRGIQHSGADFQSSRQGYGPPHVDVRSIGNGGRAVGGIGSTRRGDSTPLPAALCRPGRGRRQRHYR
jgi:2-polyprenyl-6-methoxyphenol hydroxylase-like FAD-dependent oxidoreductase